MRKIRTLCQFEIDYIKKHSRWPQEVMYQCEYKLKGNYKSVQEMIEWAEIKIEEQSFRKEDFE